MTSVPELCVAHDGTPSVPLITLQLGTTPRASCSSSDVISGLRPLHGAGAAGHKSVEMRMVYPHVLNSGRLAARRPLGAPPPLSFVVRSQRTYGWLRNKQ